MSTESRSARSTARPSRMALGAILVATIGAPVAWGVYLFGSYLYVPAACAGWPMLGLHAITVVGLLLVGVTALASWAIGRGPYAEAPIRGQSYLALFGAVLSAYFGVVILLHAWANFFTDPCLGLGLPVS